ncbi:MAG TPA: adenosylcobinamide-phosphate synthase CbiB [Stellaceae bacterium]|nr:adenosylcobinamide-phosphate synthase CbiB [Stellaceae bacterium]
MLLSLPAVDAAIGGGHSTPPMLLFASPVDPLLLLLAAQALDMVVGDVPVAFRTVPHPVVLVGRAVAWLDERLNREWRADGVRRARGILAVAVLVLAAAAIGAALAVVLRLIRFGWAVEAVVVAVLLAQRSLFDHVAAVRYGLGAGGLVGGREAVRHIVGRDPQSLDEYGVARAAIESLAENFSDGVVGPALFYALFGLPGIFVYKTVNTLDSMIGHKTARYRQFGWAAARLDDLLNLVPARFSGMLLAVAALALPKAHAGPAFRIMLRDAGKHRSPNAGWPEAATAGALDLALAGPRRYLGELVNDPWLGDGRARATVADIARALRLYVIACVLLGAVVLAAFLARNGIRF